MPPELAAAVGLGALVLTLLVHTGALFYWGGGVRQMLRDHDRRITLLEDDNGGRRRINHPRGER